MISISGFFFFQAEDGIRDLVRSRGLGDVYKRQRLPFLPAAGTSRPGGDRCLVRFGLDAVRPAGLSPVSYTHLTLPTSDLV